MYPAPFRYHRPEDLPAAIKLLSRFGDDAKVLAGGQSLIPMMKLRMGDIAEVIDIGRLSGLSNIEVRESTLCIGALATHAKIAASELAAGIPALVEAAAGIADKQVRSMGTIGGGLSVADASGDWPTCLRGLNASVVIVGAAGSRKVPISDFVVDAYATCLKSDEIVTEIQVPLPDANTSSAYVAFKRAAAAFPTCSVGVQLTLENNICQQVSLVLGCAGPTAVVSAEAEAQLQGKEINSETLRAAAQTIVAASDPPPDARGSAVFKRAMLETLVVEAGERALARCRGEAVNGGHRYA
jgi:carbon-monoxide dehydrogenase medium subunit